MTRILIPLICTVAAVFIFFGPTRGTLRATEPLTERRSDLEAALESAKRIQVVRELLQEKYNSFSNSDLGRLHKMVPSHVDNVRLIIDINAMAKSYGLVLNDVEIGRTPENTAPPGAQIVGDNPEYIDIRFVVGGSYEALKLFLADLGKSLRIVEITDINFAAKDLPSYDFSVSLRTYWLQDK